MARRIHDTVPGSPRSDALPIHRSWFPALHPAALLVSTIALGAGLAMTRSWLCLAVAAVLLAPLALRAEGRSLRAEAPILALAAVVFLAHTLLAGVSWRAAAPAAGAIALRLLALIYLLRWSARAFLGRAARWLLGLTPPRRPRIAAALLDSGRLTVSLLPLALREADQHVLALRARGLRPGRGLAGRARYLTAWFLPFLGTMLRASDTFADALLARGYALGVPRRSGLALTWGAPEWVLLVAAALLAWGIAHVL
jgi:energy-coupling factor transporter transmembrane protein EcfT